MTFLFYTYSKLIKVIAVHHLVNFEVSNVNCKQNSYHYHFLRLLVFHQKAFKNSLTEEIFQIDRMAKYKR